DVLTTGIDHVGLAVDEVVEAVLVATGHVSHREIALAEGFPRLLGQLPVAIETPRHVRANLTDMTIRHRVGRQPPGRAPPARWQAAGGWCRWRNVMDGERALAPGLPR